MTWKIKGKIGCHFPERTGLNPNFDTTQIFYSDDGVEANVKQIERVYYLPASAAANIDSMSTTDLKKAELERWLVWQRYWESAPVVRQLAQGSNYYVMQKYEPGVTDVTATKISIFTTRNATSNRCLFILDDSGILVGKSNDETIVEMELHGLEGYKRTMTFSPSFTFKAGKTYWLQYYYDGNSSAPDSYYENEQGLDYKNLSCNGHQSDTPVDMSTMSFVGKLFDSNTKHADMVATILQLNENDVFLPNKGSNWPIQGMTANYFYKRNSSYVNKFAKQVNHDSMSSNKSYPTMSELSNMNSGELIVIGYAENNSDIVYVWERTSEIIPSSVTNYQICLANDIADWMVAMNVADKTCTFTRASSDWDYAYSTPTTDGTTMYVRTSAGAIAFSSHDDAIDTVPDSPVMGRIYLKKSGASFPGTTQWTTGPMMVIYLGNNNWADFNQIDKVYTLSDSSTIQYFTKNTISTYAVDITSSVWADNNPHIFTSLNPQPTVIDISSQTLNDKRHYLEIDGNEVF